VVRIGSEANVDTLGEEYRYGLGLAAQNDPGDIEYLLTDGLGSVRQIVHPWKFNFPTGSATQSRDVCSVQSA
jgi:hypothetical protein